MQKALWFSYLLLAGCASQAPPGGGPEDKTAPEVIWTLPAVDSVRVGRDTEVQIAFSERMNRNATELSIFISPMPAGEINYRWRKNVLVMTFEEPFPERRTCVITVGTDAKDLHNNPMKNSHSFAFSTGDSIDRGEIRGRVYSDRARRIGIWAYAKNDNPAFDDSMIYKKRADYITQAAANGEYTLSYLAPSDYRVYAVVDVNEDYVYSPSVDLIGIPLKDADLGKMTFFENDMDFYLTLEDTSSFVLQTLVALDHRTLRAGFSRPLSTRYYENSADFQKLTGLFHLTDSRSRPLELLDAVLNPGRPAEVFLLTKDAIDSGSCVCQVVNLVSEKGDSLFSSKITASLEPGRKLWKPSYSWLTPGPSVKALPSDKVSFQFEGAVGKSSVEKAFSLTDSAGAPVAGQFVWWNAARFDFVPNSVYRDQMSYQITIDSSIAEDWRGKRFMDSLFTATFMAFKQDTLGFVTGRVADKNHSGFAYRINCRPLQKAGRPVSLPAEPDGSFTIRELVAGRYVLDGFQDIDGNRRYTFGGVAPMKFSERFAVYPDTLVIRPNWETSNVILRFK